MELKILAFGIVREIFGSRTISMNVNTPSVKSLMHELENKYPALHRLKSYMIAVNQDFADPDTPLHDHDEIAIIPPVSGG